MDLQIIIRANRNSRQIKSKFTASFLKNAVKSRQIHGVVKHLLLGLHSDHTGQLKQIGFKWL